MSRDFFSLAGFGEAASKLPIERRIHLVRIETFSVMARQCAGIAVIALILAPRSHCDRARSSPDQRQPVGLPGNDRLRKLGASVGLSLENAERHLSAAPACMLAAVVVAAGTLLVPSDADYLYHALVVFWPFHMMSVTALAYAVLQRFYTDITLIAGCQVHCFVMPGCGTNVATAFSAC